MASMVYQDRLHELQISLAGFELSSAYKLIRQYKKRGYVIAKNFQPEVPHGHDGQRLQARKRP